MTRSSNQVLRIQQLIALAAGLAAAGCGGRLANGPYRSNCRTGRSSAVCHRRCGPGGRPQTRRSSRNCSNRYGASGSSGRVRVRPGRCLRPNSWRSPAAAQRRLHRRAAERLDRRRQPPEFKAVTGISTGALIAPFAFLGPEYDATLRQFYTGITTKDILTKRSLLAALF